MNLSTCLKFVGNNWNLYLNKKIPPSSVFWKYLRVDAYFNASFETNFIYFWHFLGEEEYESQVFQPAVK